MPDSTPIENEFLSQITEVVEKNIANEQFGVSELAEAMNMSRSNLLRKVKKLTNQSVSQLISQVRLHRGMDLLQGSSLNVSEVSRKVGFGSTSYFIKCFREYYGYPPGEVGKRNEPDPQDVQESRPQKKRPYGMIGAGVLVTALVGLTLFYFFSRPEKQEQPEKSIAVLPFKNESNDATNVYLINGLMESTLNNLQQIKDLRVTSRTTAEKYRNTSRSIPEMAVELNVNYFVEGSGQKVGDRILLNIQLIDGRSDRHLWAKQYRREVKDIFELQEEIAKNIADEIRAVITPEEEKKIKKKPTENLEAYDAYLRGKELFYESSAQSMQEAIPYFDKAIQLDGKFALAYANAVMVLYYLDIFQVDKRFTARINDYADKAMLHDPKSDESLIAKALSFAHRKDYESAVPYLEKAHDENPNSGLVVHFLTEFYSMFVPAPAKYLEYGIKGVKIDVASSDSVTLSFKYFHLANAYMQAGFIDEAIENVKKSLAYNPDNPFSGYVGVLFNYARNKDLKLTRKLLIEQLQKDTSRVDILKEVAKVCYVMRDYESANSYYSKFIRVREMQNLDIFLEEDLAIAFVFSRVGQKGMAETYARRFKDYADKDKSIYKNFHLATYYAYRADAVKAIAHLKLFSKEDKVQYWVLLLGNDPVMDPVKNSPQFKTVMHDIETRFWINHEITRNTLEKKGLL